MALTHNTIETRPYLAGYLVKISVTDSVSGRVWSRQFNPATLPDAAGLNALGLLAIARIQAELDFEDNAMNRTSDEERLLEYYRNIKRDIVLRVRQFPGASAQQAKDYIAIEYPDSPFGFDALYAIWIDMIDVSTWQEFKTWVKNKSFRGID